MEKQNTEYSARQRRKAYFKKKTAIYQQQGYRQAKRLTRDKSDYSAHCYAYMIDVSLAVAALAARFPRDPLRILPSVLVDADVLDHARIAVLYQHAHDRADLGQDAWAEPGPRLS